jgi:hypothetical protein
MFCQHCGFEYTHKTNYCKSCGGNLTSSDNAPVIQPSSLKITGVFFVIAAFVLFSLMYVYSFYTKMIYSGLRGYDLLIPFILGIMLIGAVAGLLSWQLSRVITTARKLEGWTAKQERPTLTEVQPQARLVSPTDPIRSAVESPSVVEHTTRQMAGVYKSPAARE